jgi:biopolymer transport protein ExbD
MTLTEITAALSAIRKKIKDEPIVTVSADRDIFYGDAFKALAAVRSANVWKVALMTEPPKQNEAPH